MASKKIFIVDDDEMMTSMLFDHLSENPDYDIRIFYTGEECLANLKDHPDVIILDYYLNSIDEKAKDGMQILEKIKATENDIFVIMLSSQENYLKALQTISKGALEYVVKDKNSFNRIDNILASLD